MNSRQQELEAQRQALIVEAFDAKLFDATAQFNARLTDITARIDEAKDKPKPNSNKKAK